MRKVVTGILVLCLLLSGCEALSEGEYTWQASHPIQVSPGSNSEASVTTYDELYKALERLVAFGSEEGTIYVDGYLQDTVAEDAQRAVEEVHKNHPIAAYAVEKISCQLGTSASKAALAVKIEYLHDKSEIRKIKRVADINQAKEAVAAALMTCETGIVMQVESYEDTDFAQIVEDYALLNPQYVIENPRVHVNVYPENGKTRVVEIKFSYQTSRDELKKMQEKVQPVFYAATLYVSEDGTQEEKFSQLLGFIMTRFDYKLKTSITPAYHLLHHGVADSRAFAMVYAAMCRQVGLTCMMVTGTREGEPWYWNIVYNDGVYYHVDLLRSKELGEYCQFGDAQMEGYVWDFSAYPACGPQQSGEETDTP